MVRAGVAVVNKGVMAINNFYVIFVGRKGGDIWVVLPKLRAARANIGKELVGVTTVQIPDSSGEHNNIAGRLKIF